MRKSCPNSIPANRRSFAPRSGSLLAFDPSEAETAAAAEAIRVWRQLPNVEPAKAREFFIRSLMNHNDFVTLR